ncbi:MAG: hypothetical protein FJY67_08740 [Calditrichaeota bacterium]|nr:hypothetical protein [Calditrichota bacterium]
MHRFRFVLVVALIMLISSASQADLGVALGIKGGSLGAGVELSKRIYGKWTVRGALNQFTYKLDGDIEDKDMAYEADLNLSSWSVILDWHPWNGVFRLCGGIVNNGNNFVGVIKSTKTYTVGGRSLTPEDQGELEATIDWEPMAPYIGFGWGNATEPGKFFGLNLDIGAMFQNAPSVTMKGTKMMQAMEAEAPKIEDSLSGAKTWLVASLGFSFHF